MKRLTMVVLLTLAACATREQLDAQDDKQCRSYGLSLGTPQYAQCRMLIEQQRQANAAAANAQLLGASIYLNQQSQPYTLGPSGAPLTCQTFGYETRCQ